ncbi:DUF817 family protein [Kribbella sp.]|uniref:DUF817 family protein n=1 Tax=Kribbella sp. TaxID=1871183 RepID=UPI0032C232FC
MTVPGVPVRGPGDLEVRRPADRAVRRVADLLPRADRTVLGGPAGDAAVGSYICQAWRRFDLRVSNYRPLPTTIFAVLIYANFFTHHWIPDLRIPIALGLLVVLRRT